MATHSGLLAWEILWTEEPGGQRVGHDLATEQELLGLDLVRGI